MLALFGLLHMCRAHQSLLTQTIIIKIMESDMNLSQLVDHLDRFESTYHFTILKIQI